MLADLKVNLGIGKVALINPLIMRLILISLLAVFTVSGALAQQFTVTIPGGHDREWYEHHGYQWHDGQWYRGEDRERHEYRGHHSHHGYWKDGHYYRYGDEDRD